MLTFGTRLILLLLLIGGAVAIIGNIIGRSIGRRRLTIFGLRPRYTATAITVLTGILIALTTISVILMVSQDARTALFGLEELRREVSQKSDLLAKTKFELSLRAQEKDVLDQELLVKQRELNAAKNDLSRAQANLKKAKREIASLENTKIKLTREIEVSRKGNVLFRVNEVLLTSVIKAGPEKPKLEAGLKQILAASDAYARSFGVKDKEYLIFISPEDFNSAVDSLAAQTGDIVVLVKATRNTLFGETVPVRFELQENKVVYRSGDVLAELLISADLSIPEIEQQIKKLLSLTKNAAITAGVIPDASGSVGHVAYSEIFALAKKIKLNRKRVLLKTAAKQNTYTVGPLEVDFKIFYQ